MLNKTINGYTIKRKLGEGGMAEVWYAENVIGKPAAIKVLKTKFSTDDSVVERFQNEAKLMVKLTHPNIRQVYDYNMFEGHPCIIMEYLEGQDLKTMLKKHGALDSESAENYWNQIVTAVNYTHAKGVIHRDIKPSNIFVTDKGDIKLLDFGIAKGRDAVTGTQTGQKLGTLVYMSPEQITDSKHVDNRTDIYSLAVTFVHLLSGHIPYNADSSSDYAIMDQIVKYPLDMTNVPKEWQIFLTPYLEKMPDKRPKLRTFAEATPENFSDKTIIDIPVPKPKVVTSKPNSQHKDRGQQAKIFMWITGILLAMFLLLTTFVPLQILDPYPKISDGCKNFAIFFLFLNHVILNVAFIQQFKYAFSKWLLGVSSALLLLVLLIVVMFGLEDNNIITCAPITMYVGIKGLLFALIFGRTKWINAALSILTILESIWMTFPELSTFNAIIVSLILLAVFGTLTVFYLITINKKEHFYPRVCSSESNQTTPCKWQWVPKATKTRLAALGVILVVLIGLIFGMGRARISDPKTEALAQTYTVNGVSFTMKYVEGGTFQKGESRSQKISDFCIGETEVTQALWDAVMGSGHYQSLTWMERGYRGDNYPADRLSWYDCQEFISKLNELTGKKFRLAWEAEWEYAARGGIKSKGYKYSGSNNADDVVWYYKKEYGTDPHVVKTKSPNELGIYDMSGNVKEWCLDRDRDFRILEARLNAGPWGNSERALCGGCSNNDAESCSLSHSADYEIPDSPFYGFRLVLVP